MAFIYEQIRKGHHHYYLHEKSNGNKGVTYLGIKCPLAKSRGWKNLSPEIIEWLKQRAKQKTKPIKLQKEQYGRYRVIVIDPPWQMERFNRMVAGSDAGGEIPFDYPTMTLTQVKHDRKLVPIRRLMNKSGCFVFLWTTQKYIEASYGILKEWGLNYAFTMVWQKGHGMKPFNLPIFNCEFILVGKRGNIDFLTTKDFRTSFEATRRNHSQKPEEFYQLLKRISPEPRLDMFSREKHKGFDQWGNETDKYSGN